MILQVIRYLGNDRFEPTKTHKNLGQYFLDAAKSLVNEEADSEDEDEDVTDMI